MKVAVITPSYNDQQYIEKAILSVKNQTYKNIRHYIYSDASTDRSIDIIKSYSDQYDQCHVIGSVNQGQSHGRNVLIDLAKQHGYDVLAFLDGDDIWQRDHVEKNLPYLKFHDIVYSEPDHQFENGDPAYPMGFVFPKVAIPKMLLYKNFIFISTTLVKISAFDNVLFDSRLNSIEDWDVWCQLYEKGCSFVKNSSSKTVIYIVKFTNASSSQGPTKHQILETKRSLWKELRLNIGNNIQYDPDVVNISESASNVDCNYDLPNLPYDDAVIHEITVNDLIEKLGYHESALAIQYWHARLVPGGKLIIRTPDFQECCREFSQVDINRQIEMYNLFFGDPHNHNSNRFLFTEQQLVMHLNWSNFRQIRRLPDQKNYLTLEAIK